MQAKAVSSHEYANKVVREVEKGTTGIVWAGTDAASSRLASWMMPQLLVVSSRSRRHMLTYRAKVTHRGL